MGYQIVRFFNTQTEADNWLRNGAENRAARLPSAQRSGGPTTTTTAYTPAPATRNTVPTRTTFPIPNAADPTPRMRNGPVAGTDVHLPTGGGTTTNDSRFPRPPPRATTPAPPRSSPTQEPEVFHGYERFPGERYILIATADPTKMLHNGYSFVREFTDYGIAQAWQKESLPGTQGSHEPWEGQWCRPTGLQPHRGPNPGTQGSAPRAHNPAFSAGVTNHGQSGYQRNTEPNPRGPVGNIIPEGTAADIINVNDLFASHLDPSAGNEEAIYNKQMGRIQETDEALLPVGAVKQGKLFVAQVYSSVLDVTALPDDRGEPGKATTQATYSFYRKISK